MALQFLNGGSPGYAGVVVGTVGEALTQIRDLLVLAGWTVESGSPTSLPLILRSGREVAGVRAFLRFTNPSGTILRLNGDFDGTGTSLSTAREWTLSASSRIWITADEGASVVYVKPSTGNGSAYVFGWPDPLVDPTDGYAWIVGLLTSSSSFGIHQSAQQYGGVSKWQGNLASSGISSNLFTGSSVYNQCNADRPEIGPYFTIGANGQFRGFFPFAVSGMSGLPAGAVYPLNSEFFIATGVAGFRVA